MIFGVAQLGASPGGPIRSIQITLQHMGMPVRPTGTLDQATVDAINGVFNGWDDAPPKLRTGKLTAHDIVRQLPIVSKFVHAAAGGAQVFHDVNG